MSRFKLRTSLGDVVGFLLIVGIILALAWPVPADYAPAAKISEVLLNLGTFQASLQRECIDGSFPAKMSPVDLGAGKSRYLSHIEIQDATQNRVRVKVVLNEMRQSLVLGLISRTAVPQGSSLEIEYSCAADKAVHSRLASSTIDAKYLPNRLGTP